MNFPSQHLTISIKDVANKFNVSDTTAKSYLKMSGASKTREQYEQDATTRREIAFNLRQQGLKYKEIAEILGISINNAQQLVRRYK